jgi:hypothetical protein
MRPTSQLPISADARKTYRRNQAVVLSASRAAVPHSISDRARMSSAWLRLRCTATSGVGAVRIRLADWRATPIRSSSSRNYSVVQHTRCRWTRVDLRASATKRPSVAKHAQSVRVFCGGSTGAPCASRSALRSSARLLTHSVNNTSVRAHKGVKRVCFCATTVSFSCNSPIYRTPAKYGNSRSAARRE